MAPSKVKKIIFEALTTGCEKERNTNGNYSANSGAEYIFSGRVFTPRTSTHDESGGCTRMK